jgi:hypothetical protein
MSKIVRTIEDLDQDAKGRVLRWAWDRYSLPADGATADAEQTGD